jgi:hypothetical protein
VKDSKIQFLAEIQKFGSKYNFTVGVEDASLFCNVLINGGHHHGIEKWL